MCFFFYERLQNKQSPDLCFVFAHMEKCVSDGKLKELYGHVLPDLQTPQRPVTVSCSYSMDGECGETEKLHEKLPG